MYKNFDLVPEDKYLESFLGEIDEEEPDEEDDYICPDCGMPYADCLCE